MPFIVFGDSPNGLVSYSKAFILELFRRYPGDEKLFGILTEECPIYNYVEPPCPHREIRAGWAHVGEDMDFLQTDTGLWLSIDYTRFAEKALRSDERIIELIRERGINFASAKYTKLGIAYVPAYCNWEVIRGSPERVEWSIPKDDIINSLLGRSLDFHPLIQRLQDEEMTIGELQNEMNDTVYLMNKRIPREFYHA